MRWTLRGASPAGSFWSPVGFSWLWGGFRWRSQLGYQEGVGFVLPPAEFSRWASPKSTALRHRRAAAHGAEGAAPTTFTTRERGECTTQLAFARPSEFSTPGTEGGHATAGLPGYNAGAPATLCLALALRGRV